MWTDPANNTAYVVNGHNRLARANQLGIPTLPTRELPAATAEEARALGALANIKEGRGTVFDAAKFMRDTGITSPEQLQRMGAPMTDGHAARGLALSQLPDNIFQAAVDGRLSVGKAAALGGSGLDETQMQRAYKALSSGKDMSDAKFSEIVQQVRNAPVVEGSQVDLFGNTEAMSLMGQKADLVTAIRGDLLKEKRVFGTAARGAGRLEQGGNVINVENSRAIAADAGQVLGMFDQLKYAPGPVGELLNDGARQIAEGAKPGVIADRIRGQVAEAVRSAMDEQGLPTARPAAAAAEAAEAAPQVVELTPEQRQAAQIEVIRRAVDEAEVRPPETPIPELPDGPALTPDLARADLETRGGQVEPGTPAAQAVADEIRLTAEFAERDAQMRAIAEEGAKDAMGYELKTFEEKKALGMTDGYDPEPVMPTEVMPRDTGPSIADMFEQQSRDLAQSDARLYRRAGEGLQRMREGLDQLDQLEDPALAPAPVRPEPLQLADGPPIELDTRGKGEFFHGAASEFELERGGEFGGDGMNIYGYGFYVTDDIKTAAGYRKKNAGGAKTGGVVYRITELSPVKLYDLDKPLTKADVKRLRPSLSTRGRELFDEAIEQFEALPTLAQAMDEMRAWSREFDMPAHQVQEEFFGMQEALEKQGYGGYTHQGGNLAGKGKRLHQVRIYWDPAEKLAIEKVDPMMGEPRTKTADQATRQQIQANEQRMAELRRKMQDEGCSL